MARIAAPGGAETQRRSAVVGRHPLDRDRVDGVTNSTASGGGRRRLLSPFLDRLVTIGTLTVVDAQGHRHRFGGGAEPSVTIRLHDPALHRRLVFHGGLAFGEAHMDGTLTVEDGTLYDALDLTLANLAVLADRGGPAQQGAPRGGQVVSCARPEGPRHRQRLGRPWPATWPNWPTST